MRGTLFRMALKTLADAGRSKPAVASAISLMRMICSLPPFPVQIDGYLVWPCSVAWALVRRCSAVSVTGLCASV